MRSLFVTLSLVLPRAFAVFSATETTTELIVSNSRLYASVNKAYGAVWKLTLDGQDLLGPKSGSLGIGPYLDCSCVPSGSYVPGSLNARYKLIKGVDSTNTAYGGIVMSETYPSTGQILEQYWFLRDGETGLHTFSRLVYNNKTTLFLRNLQEFRTLFRPNTALWTNLIAKPGQAAPLPSKDAIAAEVVVQDATWYLGNTPKDPYVTQFADFFTKYTFSESFRELDAYGMYADGSKSSDGSTFGAWLVMNTKDTYFGGPIHSDLTVDGIVYNYMVSNHHGAGTPNITDGFDRTIGPQYYYFNKGKAGTPLETLRQDARQYASPTWNTAFYDSIAQYVPNYVPSSRRGTWKGKVDLPVVAKRPIAVLAQNGVDYQDNVLDPTAYQYWADINSTTGDVQIPMVKAGTYRLTVYADGIFGNFIKDDVKVAAGSANPVTQVQWREETAGKEIWRIGTPDRSSNEYRHGNNPDPTKPLHPAEHLIYWARYDFINDFPEGVTFEVGKSNESVDMNYVHWALFGGKANYFRPVAVYSEKICNWTLLWDSEEDLTTKTKVTFTVQLAGAKTQAGNTDVFNATEPYSNLPYNVAVNGNALDPWIIPYYQSSSCAVRSGGTCYQLAHKFTFSPKLLVKGQNEIILSLPLHGTSYETSVLPEIVYVQYDALRLEIV